MIRFNNDYSKSAHPEVLNALVEDSENSYGGYGIDDWCLKGADAIKEKLEMPDADVHFLVGGTQTNYTIIASILRHYQSVISASTGHINSHETGSIERCGFKIETVPNIDGKISAKDVDKLATDYKNSPVPEHITMPKVVYISHPTEFGTIYSKGELKDLHDVCKKHNLYLMVDGARLSYALTSPATDVTLPDLAKYADAFYLGGTKCGALFGEAVVFTDKNLSLGFRNCMKQNGALLAKGWLLGLQFYTLMKDNLYLDIAKSAIEQAMRIKQAFMDKGVSFLYDSPTNQQFVILTDEQIKKLSRDFIFEDVGKADETHSAVRFCTSWYTKDSEVDMLIEAIKAL